MGYSEMTASAPEDAKKCWLKVTYEGRARLVEWNSNSVTFKDLETKVKKMFGLNEKHRVILSYQGVGNSEIIMSSDEELSSALHFMNGDVILATLTLDRKKKKGILSRALRAAKAQRPVVMGFISSLPSNIYARLPHVNIYALAYYLRFPVHGNATNIRFGSPQRADSVNNNNNNAAPPLPRRPCRLGGVYRKLTWCVFFLVLALFFAHARSISHMKNEWRQYYRNHHSFNQHPHVTILNANYGGKDVTQLAQTYYNKHGRMQASNLIFGDPATGTRKFLHVVYQHVSPQTGLAEVFSQSFPESYMEASFSMTKENCAFPEEAIVDGRSVKVLGALYEDAVASCAARRLAATGRFSSNNYYHFAAHHRDSVINRNHFGSNSPYGIFTLVYLKDNQLQTWSGREGASVAF